MNLNDLNVDVPGAPVELALFALFSLLAVVGAVRVITASDPFISALSLLFNFVSLGALYLLLDQPFVAVAQILVYAGAVVVLFLFVIGYLGDTRELSGDATRARGVRPFALLAALTLGAVLIGWFSVARFPDTVEQLPRTEAGNTFGSATAVGEVFLTDYLLAFEVTSLVLLVAAIGGIVLGLTGRARHERLRKVMQTRSADQQRREYDRSTRELVERRRAEREAEEQRS